MRSERDQDLKKLEREINSKAHSSLLRSLQSESALLSRFTTWNQVVTFMRQGTSRDPTKDAILLPIFQAHFADHDPRWRTILLVIFWPGLESIYRKRRSWDRDPDELWTNVYWAFHETICKIDPDRRRERLVQKVMNDVFHRLHDQYRQEWDRSGREIGSDCDVLAATRRVSHESDTPAAILREEQQARIAMLQKHRAAGRIGEADFLLLVGTRVYGWSLADYAHKTGLAYETIKKRHQRAVHAIGGFPAPGL